MPVVVHLQAGLPEVAEFMNTELSHVMHDDVSNYIDLKIIPFGNTEFYKGSRTFSCPNGRKECKAELLQACGLKIYDLKIAFTYIKCIQNHIDDLDKWGWNCAFNSQLDHNSIKACAREEREVMEELYYASRETTKKKFPTIPYVVINGDVCPGNCKGLKYSICGHFPEDSKPETCQGVPTFTFNKVSTNGKTVIQRSVNVKPLVKSQAKTKKRKTIYARLRVFYTSISTESMGLFTDLINNIIPNQQIMEHTSIELYPFGQGTLVKNPWTYKCPQGQQECHFNMLHACIIDMLKDVPTSATIIQKGSSQLNSLIGCVDRKIDFYQLRACSTKEQGKKLITKSFDILNSEFPEGLVSEPSIKINDVVCKGQCPGLQSMLIEEIEKKKAEAEEETYRKTTMYGSTKKFTKPKMEKKKSVDEDEDENENPMKSHSNLRPSAPTQSKQSTADEDALKDKNMSKFFNMDDEEEDDDDAKPKTTTKTTPKKKPAFEDDDEDEVVNISNTKNKQVETKKPTPSKDDDDDDEETTTSSKGDHHRVSSIFKDLDEDDEEKKTEQSSTLLKNNLYSIRHLVKPVDTYIVYDIFNPESIKLLEQVHPFIIKSIRHSVEVYLLPLLSVTQIDQSNYICKNTFDNSNNNDCKYISLLLCTQNVVHNFRLFWDINMCLLRHGSTMVENQKYCFESIPHSVKAIETCISSNYYIELLGTFFAMYHARVRPLATEFMLTNTPFISINTSKCYGECNVHEFICDHLPGLPHPFCGGNTRFIANAEACEDCDRAVITRSPPSPGSTRVDLYLDSMCLGCNQLVADLFSWIMKKLNANQYIDLYLHYGMGISLSNKSIRDPLVCPLGKTQCLLGIVNMCILELYPDPIYHWSTIRCLASYHHNALDHIDECIDAGNLDTESVYKCVNEGRGVKALIREINSNSNSRQDITSVPAVFINDDAVTKVSKILPEICSSFKHKPTWCSETYKSTLQVKKCSLSHVDEWE